MKLYTEEQIKHTLQLMGLHIMINEFIKKAESIELPSDEDIYSILRGKKMFDKDWGFIEGAKWMKEQILNQNK